MGGKKWKSFMAKLYGFGAAIVIIGAMFKIMHWPGAGPMLVVGLSTEAVIFFFSAFEPPHLLQARRRPRRCRPSALIAAVRPRPC